MPEQRSAQRVVLIGGGHAHVEVLRQAAQRPLPGAELVLVSDTPHALYSGMVPGLVAGEYAAGDLSIDLPWLAARAGARWIEGRLVAIDAARREFALESGEVLGFELASLDIGSTPAGLDTPGAREHALATRPLSAHVPALLARARARAGFRLAVVGAGAGGVELALAFRQQLRRAGDSVALIDAATRPLPGFGPRVSRRAERACRQRGIEMALGVGVRGVATSGVALDDGRTLEADAVVWVAGAAAHALVARSGLPTDARGFLRVGPALECVGLEGLFAAGDTAALEAHPGTPKAGVYAVRAGPVLARNLRARLEGRALETFAPQRDFLVLLNLGDGTALGTKWGRCVEGRWVRRIKDRIDRGWLARYRAS